MSRLEFHIERVELEDPVISEEMRHSWTLVFTALIEYVQPDSTLSLDEAINRTVGFYEEGGNPCPILRLSFFLGQNIPYDNPAAHTRLANYLIALGKSEKLPTSVHPRPSLRHEEIFYSKMINNFHFQEIDLSDLREDEDPIEYVNSQAFQANIMSRDLLEKCINQSTIYSLGSAMYNAFNPAGHSEEQQQVRDARIMGAAQWIIWRSEEAFSLVRKPGDPEIKRVRKGFYFWQKRKQTAVIEYIWPYSWENWQHWKAGFKKAAGNEAAYSLKCRNLAERAANLMSLQEKCTENGYPVSPLKANMKAASVVWNSSRGSMVVCILRSQ